MLRLRRTQRKQRKQWQHHERLARHAARDHDDAPTLTTALGSTFVEDLELLSARVGVLDDRLANIETRLAEAGEAAAVTPEQRDLLDAEVRSAKVAAELHLVTLELRSELSRLTEHTELATNTGRIRP
ncbi:MAG: hypothetical protein ACRD0G_18190 [Acidimicrobiales bacterium]